MNAFMNFSNAHREDVREENPDLKMSEIAKVLGQIWRELSANQKAKYDYG